MNLVLDIGNTSIKAGWFSNARLLHYQVFNGDFPAGKWWEFNGAEPGSVFYCSVRKMDPAALSSLPVSARKLSHETHLPIRNLYQTPETLGPDRLANAVGGMVKFPGKIVVILDAGTCLKTDVVLAEGAYIGGAISPGLRMRYKALHSFTEKLPLLEPVPDTPLTGSNTSESIHSGVLHGMKAEMEGIMDEYSKIYKDPVFLLTGGDHALFLSRLKSRIFAAPALTLEGLNAILLHNQ